MTTSIINTAMVFTGIIGILTVGFLVWKLIALFKYKNVKPETEVELAPKISSGNLIHNKKYASDSNIECSASNFSGDHHMVFTSRSAPVYEKILEKEPKTVLMYPGSNGKTVFARLKFIKVADAPSERIVFLTKEETTLGRSSKEDITLADKFISRHHAVFLFDGSELKIMDKGSLNGTFINGKKIKSNMPIVISERSGIVMGATSFSVERCEKKV